MTHSLNENQPLIERPQTSIRLKHFFKLTSDFEKTKCALHTFGNYYTNYFFSTLGYQFNGKIDSPNILHLSAEAWLLGVFSDLKKDNNEPKNEPYNQILSHVKNVIVSTPTFIDNVTLLTLNYGIDEPALKGDEKIFDIILVNLNGTKTNILKDIDLDHFVSRQEFEDIFIKIFRTAFNYTLNEFNSREENKKNLDMLNIYTTLSAEKEQKTFNDYFETYLKGRGLDSSEALPQVEREKIKGILEKYYNFCRTDFEDLIDEIYFFNKNAASVLFKLTKLLSPKNLKRIIRKYYDIVTGTVEDSLVKFRLDKILDLYKNLYGKVYEYESQGVTLVKNKYDSIKHWVSNSFDSSEAVKVVKGYYTQVYGYTVKYSEVPRKFVYDKVYKPIENLTLVITDTSVEIISKTINKTEQFKNYVTNTVTTSVNEVKNALFGQEALVKVSSDENEEYLSISISKKLFLIDPQRAANLIQQIIQNIKDFDIKETSLKAYTYTKTKYEHTKEYIYDSYKKFLEFASEDEICDNSLEGK